MNKRYKHFSIRKISYVTTILILISTMVVPAITSEETSVIVIKAGTIYPVTSPPIQDGIVLISNGKIEAVGKDLEIPEGAEVIDATDKVVIPGLIDAFTTLAENLDDEESVTPNVRAKDAFNFYGKYQKMLAGGITMVYISPGQRRLISGMGSVVKLAGDSVDERCLKETSALRITIGELPKNPPEIFKPPIPPDPDNPILPVEKQLPTTRMAELAMLRNVFAETQQYQNQPPDKMDSKIKALLPVLDNKIPVRINCHNAQDILSAISFAEAFNLRLIIEGATEAYKVIDEIKQSKAAVVVSGILQPGRRESKDYTREIAFGSVNPENASILAKAGVKFAIHSPTDETIPDLQFIAGYAISQGLSPEEALRAITISPAEILGVADRVGSIEKGKDADLVILKGQPFEVQSTVDRTLINGMIAYAQPAEEAKTETAAKSLMAIRAGKIFTASRGQINDGLILIADRKITYVGEPKAIPQEAVVIDANKSVVIPGMIDIHSHLGLHWESEPLPLDSQAPTSGPDSSKLRLVSIARAVAPSDQGFQEVLRSGVTSVLLAPETRGLVSGNAALIKLAGDSMQDMIVKEYAAIKFSMLGEGAKLAQIWEVRELLTKAKEYADKWDKYEREHREYEHRQEYERHKPADKKEIIKEPERPRRDPNLELLRRLFKREMPALVHANRADEIRNALKVFRDEYNLDVIILGGDDGHRTTSELRRYDTGVAIGPNIIRYEKGKLINNADILTRNGLHVAFHTSSTSGTQYLPMNAAYAVRYGMDEDKAFRAITIYPAELLQVDDRIGSIDVGKDADLVILSGEPFDFSSRVEKVIVNGRVVFERKG